MPKPNETSQASEDAPIGYRLLWKVAPSGYPRQVAYIVSVDTLLTEIDFKRVVCEVIDKEEPEQYDMISISVYYRF